MGFADIHGRARVNARSPSAFGICDDCGFTFNRRDLEKQVEYAGSTLQWQGTYVCHTCNDAPQPQLKPIILPGDPAPVIQPRPEYPYLNFGLQGFSAYTLWANGQPPPGPFYGPAQLLANIQQVTGIPAPAGVVNRSGTTVSQAAQTLINTNPLRDYLVIFNPTSPEIGVSFGIAAIGIPPTILLGPGEALFWANAQNLGAVNTAAMTVVSQFSGAPYYVWEAEP